jgi:hypothetical protein
MVLNKKRTALTNLSWNARLWRCELDSSVKKRIILNSSVNFSTKPILCSRETRAKFRGNGYSNKAKILCTLDIKTRCCTEEAKMASTIGWPRWGIVLRQPFFLSSSHTQGCLPRYVSQVSSIQRIANTKNYFKMPMKIKFVF